MVLVLAAAGSVFLAGGASAAPLPWMDTSLTPVQRADLLVSAMTLEQKIAQLHGDTGVMPELPECRGGTTRHVTAIPALAIPTFRITNGPVGLGGGDCNPQDKGTALPVALALAAGFDPNLAFTFGELMGKEARQLGLHELEGPGMNMGRVGVGGRNFEYFGEDPILAGTLAVREIQGIQSNSIIAMAKHFVLNDQEQNRMTYSADISDRVLHELYLLPYEMSVKDGRVASIMCSYNRMGGVYACDNPYLLTDVLRNQWGFEGYVQSDFGATHSTAPSLNAGQDLEMRTASFYTPARINAALADGSLTTATIDRALKRRYTQMFKFGIFDRPITRTPIDSDTAQANGAVARAIGEQVAVLLKNQGNLLPLNAASLRTIAVIGQATYANAAASGGGGSSRVSPTYTVTPMVGLQNTLTSLGSGAVPTLTVVPNNPTAAQLAAVTAAAAAADAVIVMAGVVTAEGTDRPSLSLPNNQDAILDAVAAAGNPRTVLVLKDGDPVLMPWVASFPAILEAWNPGQEDGNIVARLLFGVVNPSGKLPMTYPKLASDVPTATAERYPGVTVGGNPTVYYSEELKMGYRWYDAQNVEPLFPFGHGLSYTTFAYSNLQVTPAQSDGTVPFTVSFTVRNTGSRAGADVPQIYAGFLSSYGEPPKRLVGFQKVMLNPGEQRQVSITIDPRSNAHPLSFWDTTNQLWTAMNGGLTFYLARSARDIDSKTGATLVFTNSGVTNDVNGDMQVNCQDLIAARLAIGTRTGQVGYLPTADIDHNGVVDVRDISAISRTLPAGTVCK